jgi:hypothetical protein
MMQVFERIALLAERRNDGPTAVLLGIEFLVLLVVIAGFWKTFQKAGKPGWASIVPIYNLIVLLEIAGQPLWWIILLFIPLVNIAVSIFVNIAVAKNFGKSTGFGVGLALLGFIFYPILGFGDARYRPDSPDPSY